MFAFVPLALLALPLPAQDPGSQDEGLRPRVALETSMGTITLELEAEKAPITVDNFLSYVADGFYDGLTFHRVIKNFMIQGGGFTEDHKQRKEGLRAPILNEWKTGLKNMRGTIAMARTTEPNSATAQFFINVVDNLRLSSASPSTGDAGYCAFGKVVSGMDVADEIRAVATKAVPGLGTDVPSTTVSIRSAKIVSKVDRKKITALAEKAKAKEAERKAAENQKLKKLADTFARTMKNGKDEEGRALETTASGLQYIVLEEGNGKSPEKTDTVVAHYTGWTLDGKKFDSSHDRGAPTPFPLNRVIAGWTEGVGMMKVGGKRRLIIPGKLAYGPRGVPRAGIGPNATLVFDIELLEIK